MMRLSSVLVVALGLLALPVACSDKPATAIVLALSSEAELPKEIDSVTILVTRGPDVRFSRTYLADKETNTINLPGTLTIQPREDEDPKQPIKVQILGNLKEQQVVVRTATMSFAEEKQKLLRMAIRYSCVDVPQTCGDGTTCIGGRCVSDLVAPEKLPDLPAEAELFPTRGSPACFDADDSVCAANRIDIPLTEEFKKACEFDTGLSGEPLTKLNLFAFWSRKADQGHPLVLEAQSEEGWSTGSSPSKIKLSEGMCRAVREGRIRKLGYNSACATKQETQPLCLPRAGERVTQKFFENECHKCVYEQAACKEHLDGARSPTTQKPKEAGVMACINTCEFDGQYNSLDECGAVKGCFFACLAPMLECQGEVCKDFENLVRWGQCLQANEVSAASCADLCGASKANAGVCEKK